MAAAQGDPIAQDTLARMYESGDGVPQDIKEALKWYRLAAKQGFAKAQEGLERVQRHVSQAGADTPAAPFASLAVSPQPVKQQRVNGKDADNAAIHSEINASPSWLHANSFFGALLTSGVAAIFAFLLFQWIRVKGVASSAHQMGRKWLAWVVLCVTFAALPRFFLQSDANHLAPWVLGVTIFGGLGYGLGWTYCKLIRGSPWKRAASWMEGKTHSRLYAVAWDEIQSGNVDKGLWARSYAQCAGNKEKTLSLYLKERVKELKRSSAE
jgi:hypothetical protein